jgi:hypothetical protein
VRLRMSHRDEEKNRISGARRWAIDCEYGIGLRLEKSGPTSDGRRALRKRLSRKRAVCGTAGSAAAEPLKVCCSRNKDCKK